MFNPSEHGCQRYKTPIYNSVIGHNVLKRHLKKYFDFWPPLIVILIFGLP